MSSKPEFKTAQRVQESLLAPLERPTLQWLARNMPSWIGSDTLTLLALVSMAAAGAFFLLAKDDLRWIYGVPVALAFNWFGDSLDGTVARYRNRQRPRYGFYVDHICDCLSVIFISGGMALSGLMSETIALGVIIAYLMLSVEAYLTTYTIGTFHISIGLFSPTELRILLALGVLALIRWPHATIAGERYLSLDVGGVCAIAGMGLMFVWMTVRHIHQLYNAERLD